jgi:hypothetical protein
LLGNKNKEKKEIELDATDREKAPLKSPESQAEKEIPKMEKLPQTSENNGNVNQEPIRNIIVVQADPEISKPENKIDNKELHTHIEIKKVEEEIKEEKKIEEKKEVFKQEEEKPEHKKELEDTDKPHPVVKVEEKIPKKKSSLPDSSSSIIRKGRTKNGEELPEWKVKKRFFNI